MGFLVVVLDAVDMHVRRGARYTEVFREGTGKATLRVDRLSTVGAKPVAELIIIVTTLCLAGFHLHGARGGQRKVLTSCRHCSTAGMCVRAIGAGNRIADVRAEARKAAMMCRKMDQ